jgi:hypothetical protein
MAISTLQSGGIYDINRDMYAMTPREAYEREMFQRRQEEEYRRMQNNMNPPGQDLQSKYALAQAPKQDPKDPLSFLSKADNKLLLTGEAP